MTHAGAALPTSIAATMCRHPHSHQQARTDGLSPAARNPAAALTGRGQPRVDTPGPADSTGAATRILGGRPVSAALPARHLTAKGNLPDGENPYAPDWAWPGSYFTSEGEP